jgi:hypothetical protein
MGKLIFFTNTASKLHGWITTARYLAKENSISRAGKWVKEYVPKQFHAHIHAELIYDKQKRTKDEGN